MHSEPKTVASSNLVTPSSSNRQQANAGLNFIPYSIVICSICMRAQYPTCPCGEGAQIGLKEVKIITIDYKFESKEKNKHILHNSLTTLR